MFPALIGTTPVRCVFMAPPPPRPPRHWRTMPGDTPGVCGQQRRHWARVSVRGRWVRIKSYESKWDAARVSLLARQLTAPERLQLAALRCGRRLRFLMSVVGGKGSTN